MGGSSDPSMILYRTKLIKKVGPIEGGSEAFNRTGGGSGRAVFAEARLDRNQQRLVLRGRSENHSVPLAGEHWNEPVVRDLLPQDIADHVVQQLPLVMNYAEKDRAFGMQNSARHYTIHSAWHLFREKGPQLDAYKYIWTQGLPIKISLFSWRVWHCKLPLDDILTRLGYTMPSRSWCCNRPTVETMQYIFLKSQCADKVFQRWWKHPANVYLKPLYQALPCVVVWELWKRRNKRRYGGNISLNRLISQVSATLHNLLVYKFPKMKRLSSNWPELVSELESYIRRLYYRRLCWEFPSGQWIKCNKDGASRGNPGKSGAAVVFRDAAGDFLCAATQFFAVQTNMFKLICVHKGFTNVVIETDSTIARLIIIQEVSAPWAVDTIVRKIITLLSDKQIRFSHVYKEGNAVADSLAKYTIDEEISGTFEEFHQLHAQARKLINIDKTQIPSFRVRVHPWRF
uniref:Uncharacterized protein LOC104217776 n=1 Tax=Nicotiana sylvestris TaxID=4096 RepID=A0A1U7VEA7_NICSY|nr:PREDICTED: uncharacterized protein LOC104217776 [Nicotiana sylvestris]